MSTKLPVQVLLNTGPKNYYQGAYTLAFVCSNQGNFLLKGYLREVEDELKKRKSAGLKYYVRFSLWKEGKCRSILKFYLEDYSFLEPSRHSSSNDRWDHKSRKYRLYKIEGLGDYKTIKSFKRLPQKWIPEFDNLH